MSHLKIKTISTGKAYSNHSFFSGYISFRGSNIDWGRQFIFLGYDPFGDEPSAMVENLDMTLVASKITMDFLNFPSPKWWMFHFSMFLSQSKMVDPPTTTR